MSLFNPPDDTNPYTEQARNILLLANQVSEQIFSLFTQGREAMFGIEGYTVADAQKLLDACDALVPGSAVKLFQLHGGLGQFLKQSAPNLITDAMLQPAVPYTAVVVNVATGLSRIVLTGTRYPTEPEPENVTPVP